MSFHLTPAERAVLVGLLAEHPYPSARDREIAAMFLARTGRRIGVQTVQYRRVEGGYRDRPPNRHRHEAQPAPHAGLVEAAGPGTPYREIADRFRAATRRAISPATVYLHATAVMGRPGRRAKESTNEHPL